MRVVHLANHHPADDVRIFLKECRSLAAAGFEVHLVAPEADEQVEDGVHVHGFVPPSSGSRPLRIVQRLWRVWRVARAVRADLCHLHEPGLVPLGLLFKLRGARVVYDVHDDTISALPYSPHNEDWKRLGLRVLEAVARRTCDGFVAATPALARSLPPERTVEVLNYPLPEEFPEASATATSGTDVVYVGLIKRARGLREMIEALGRVRDPEARLVLIGRFETLELEQEARSLPGWARVEYLGQLDRRAVGEHLAAARAGIVLFHPAPNHMEALPNKLFEYMAAGLPIIASNFPYWQELLDPIGCAIHVDPLDPADVAAAIDELLSDDGRAREMGRRGAAAVQERFNWSHEAPKLVGLYKRLGFSAESS